MKQKQACFPGFEHENVSPGTGEVKGFLNIFMSY